MAISDQNGSRLAVLYDASEEARRKADELHWAGFETWRINIISYNDRVEQAPDPPLSGSAGPRETL